MKIGKKGLDARKAVLGNEAELCPECSEPLVPHVGERVSPYLSHYPEKETTPLCSLREAETEATVKLRAIVARSTGPSLSRPEDALVIGRLVSIPAKKLERLPDGSLESQTSARRRRHYARLLEKRGVKVVVWTHDLMGTRHFKEPSSPAASSAWTSYCNALGAAPLKRALVLRAEAVVHRLGRDATQLFVPEGGDMAWRYAGGCWAPAGADLAALVGRRGREPVAEHPRTAVRRVAALDAEERAKVEARLLAALEAKRKAEAERARREAAEQACREAERAAERQRWAVAQQQQAEEHRQWLKERQQQEAEERARREAEHATRRQLERERVTRQEAEERAQAAAERAVFVEALEEARLAWTRRGKGELRPGVKAILKPHPKYDRLLTLHGNEWTLVEPVGSEWRIRSGSVTYIVPPSAIAPAAA